MDVDEATFQDEVVDRSHELPVVVDFWAEWCGPCKALAPVLEQAARARTERMLLRKVDVDANPGLATAYGIRGIPAVKAFRNGRVVDEFTGALSPASVEAFLDGLLGPSSGERLLQELTASGEFPEIHGPLAEGDHARALEWLVSHAAGSDPETRERIRDVMVAIFEELGQDDPVAAAYRRRLASILY